MKSTQKLPKGKKSQREAGHKAWRTIRTKKRLRAGAGSRTIEEYVPPRFVGSLVHPETLSEERPWKGPTSFGKNLVSLFHKTPSDIACGPFWELRWAFGCPLDCNYCYLRGTMKGRMKPSVVRIDHVLNALDEAFASIDTPVIFNSGELSDSLMNPGIMAQIADKFESQDKHKLATLSKFGPKNVEFLVSKPRKQVICAWSLNPQKVAKRWEKAAAPPEKRIEAARLVHEAGYDTRIRIDPIFPIEGWRQEYEDLLYSILDSFTPRRIVLGSPRGLWKTIKYAEIAGIDMTWANYFEEDSGWGKKLSFQQRRELYTFFYDKLRAIGYDLRRVSMCKETTTMWKALGLKYTPLTCNCYGSRAYSSD